MNLRLAVVVALEVSAIVTACGGSTESREGNSSEDSQPFISEYCRLWAPCCERIHRPTDGVDCRAQWGRWADGKTYDSSSGAACLSELRAQSDRRCDDFVAAAPSCAHAFVGGSGKKQPGETCSDESDCAPAAEGIVVCSVLNDVGTKRCNVLVVEGKEGAAPCVATTNADNRFAAILVSEDPARAFVCDSAQGTYCNSATKACATRQPVGGACDSDLGCVAAAFCESSRCVARDALGASCSEKSCVEGASCDSMRAKCVVARVAGASCTENLQCLSGRCTGGECLSIFAQPYCGGR